jgi:glycosyltransferase involved in cell wall biosynthesis
MTAPLLSVCLITYNHVNYIREAIDSILMQKVSFPWDIIIADDFSTDGTRDILLEYKEKYPDLIKLILQEKNVGAEKNWMDLITTPTSKYIAYFEGDDYWIDPYKLQKQVSFLENNENYGMIYSQAKIYNDKKGCFEKNIKVKAFTNKDLLLSGYIPTLTVLFKNDLFRQYIIDVEPVRKNWKMGDYPIWLWFLFNSKIYYLNEITGVYRLRTDSASNPSNRYKRYEFKRSSFEVSEYYAKKHCSDEEYKEFLEKRYLFLYLYCVRHNIAEKNEYIIKLKGLDKIKFSTKLVIILFYDLKFEYAFFLFNQNNIFRRLLNNLAARVVSIFCH